jgi:uncharacterized caspase-like protein
MAIGHVRYLFVAWFCVLLSLSAGCETGGEANGVPFLGERFVTMELVSNVPNSQFSARKQRLGADPEEGWEDVGSGTEVTASLSEGVRYEIAVKAAGYREKTVKLAEPIERYEFRFVESDLLSTIIASAKPTPGMRSLGDPVSPPSPTKVDKKWAVAIGISDYQQRGKWGLDALRYASSDAAAMADYLRSPAGGRFDHVELLTDRNADVRSVRVALREQLRSVQEDDLVLIFWAGHGSPDPHEPDKLYLLGYDSDPEHMASTAYAMDEFQRDVRNIRANSVILIADACHSAGVSDPTQAFRGEKENKIVESLRGVTKGPPPAAVTTSPPPETGYMSAAPNSPPRGKSILMFSSCEAGEKSRESAKLNGGHGVFTYFLLEGLRGTADRPDNNGNADGKVSLGEMVDYTTERVKRHTQNNQHPDTAGRFDRNAIIGLVQ